jgi:4-amino-4-deoxy-L-arabinose transferase-like glycosyltransferase
VNGRELTRADRWTAAALAAGTFLVTLIASTRQGIHRDEAYYMDAGEVYVTYWERTLSGRLESPLSDAAIRPYWSQNSEHPPLMKLLYGLSWRLFHGCDCAGEKELHPGLARVEGRHLTLPLFRETTAFRLPTMACFGLLCALVFLFVVEATGSRQAALAAALLTVLQPRAFFHAQTASFDLPAAMWWFATTYAYWRALERGLGAALLCGLAFGLFLATKLQSFFLPLALGAHWLWLGWSRRRERLPWPTVRPLLAMAVVGPLVLYALWPWLWHHPLDRLGAYLKFHWTHVHYNFEYLGRNYNHPPYPWHEPLGMLLTTAPVVLLALATAGIIKLTREGWRSLRGRTEADPRATGFLLLAAGTVPFAIFLRGTAPIFGETKHWLATMPVLAVCAGIALAALGEALAREWSGGRLLARLQPWALLAAAAVPAAVETVRSHPYGLSHYNALAGGAPGGADLGMNRQFWGYSVRGILDWLSERLPPGARLYLHDWNHDAYELYVRDGLLRPDLVDAGMEDPGVRSSQAALVIHERHFNKYEYMIWNAYGHLRPAHVLTLDGVPLVTVYLRSP